jgi:anti-sigma factor RsiW
MICSKFETDIALYAGGDLPAGGIPRVEAHLRECADCRELVEELRTAQALLGELPLEEAMVAQVHHRVLAEIGRADLSPRGALAPLLALAAALLLAAVLFWPRHHAPKVVAVASGAGSKPAAASHAAPTPPFVQKVRHHHHRRAPAAQPGPPLLVQFVTDNPNIVIYWLIDQKPQGD